MKKKIALVLSVLMIMMMLGACGADPKSVDYNGYSYSDLSDQTCENVYFIAYLATNLNGKELSDEERTQIKGYGFSDQQLDACAKWSEVVDEYGACTDVDLTKMTETGFDYSGMDTSSFDVTKSGETLTTDLTLKFGEQDVDFQLVYDYYSMDITGVTIEPIKTLGAKMKQAGLNTVISLAIVFSVLILISLIICAFNIFPYLEEKKKQKQNAQKASEPEPVAAPAVPEPQVPETDDAELIAVIAAAIAASEGTSTSDFVVRSINRR